MLVPLLTLMAALCLAFLAMKSWLIWKKRLLAISFILVITSQ